MPAAELGAILCSLEATLSVSPDIQKGAAASLVVRGCGLPGSSVQVDYMSDMTYSPFTEPSLCDFRTHDPCRSLAHDAMSCGSLMRAARFASYTELMLMPSSFSMCLRRRLNRLLNRSLRPADVDLEIMTE
jgi:hypothetical protein